MVGAQDELMDGWMNGQMGEQMDELGSSSVALTTVISLDFVLLPWV